MQDQSYYQLLSPAILFMFAIGFAVVGRHARDMVAPRIFSKSYVFGALGLFGDFFRPAMPELLAIPFINGLYLASAATFAGALYSFYRGAVPWRAIVLSAVAAMALLFWFRFADDSIVARTLVMNIAGGLLFILPAIALRDEMERPVDRALQALVALNGIQLIARTTVVLWYESGDLTYANYAGSAAAISFQFAISLAALAIAVNLFVMFGMEIVTGITETSRRDPLTGVLNRRGLEARIAELTETGLQGGPGHAVIIADIDRFKAVNDRHGHAAGDLVIAGFARLLSASARDGDAVVRWGGEEFLILMPRAGIAMARLYAETARTAFAAIAHDCLDGERVTASFGVAVWCGDEPIVAAATRADAALYRAKNSGRDRVCADRPGLASDEIQTLRN